MFWPSLKSDRHGLKLIRKADCPVLITVEPPYGDF